MKIFNYIFYRIAKVHYKLDGSEAIRAIGFLSFFQVLLLGCMLIGSMRLCYPVSETIQFSKFIGKIGGIIVLIFMGLNYKYYKNKYNIFDNKWGNTETPTQKWLRGFLVFLAILAPILFLLGLANVFPLPDFFWQKK